jgi:hypothetical protein
LGRLCFGKENPGVFGMCLVIIIIINVIFLALLIILCCFINLKAKSQKAKESALANKNPARVGRSGFVGLKEKLDDVVWPQLIEQNTTLEEIQDTRTKMWIAGRAKLKDKKKQLYEIGGDMKETSKVLVNIMSYLFF